MTTTQELVEQNIPLANKLAHMKKRTLPRFVDIEDLQSAAYMGLVEAASRFDPSQGVKFSTFAYTRIFGAIHDYLREQSWFRRGDRTQVRSLDEQRSDSEDCMLRDTVEAKPEDRTEECFEAISVRLDKYAKAVLRHYFIDEYSMKEVGDKFGVSESRISQLIKQYKCQIKDYCDEASVWEDLAA